MICRFKCIGDERSKSRGPLSIKALWADVMGFSYVHALGELPYLIGMILTAWWKLNSDPREQQDLLASLWPPRANHLNARRVWFWYIDDEWCESHEDHRASKPYVINRCPSEELHISNIWEILAPRDVVHGRPGEDRETKLFNLCRNWERKGYGDS